MQSISWSGLQPKILPQLRCSHLMSSRLSQLVRRQHADTLPNPPPTMQDRRFRCPHLLQELAFPPWCRFAGSPSFWVDVASLAKTTIHTHKDAQWKLQCVYASKVLCEAAEAIHQFPQHAAVHLNPVTSDAQGITCHARSSLHSTHMLGCMQGAANSL